MITEWSHRGLTAYPGSGGLQIWRPAGGSSYTLVGKSAIESFSAGVNSFSADLPVKAGDLLGLRVDSSGTGCYFIGAEGDVAGDGDSSDPAPGETRALSAVNYVRANVSATLEDPDTVPATLEDPDTVPPETTITSGPSGATKKNSPRFAFASSEPGSTFICSLNNSPGAACSSPKSFPNLRDGNYTFSVRAVDRAGNADSTAAARSFTVDSRLKCSVFAKKKQKQQGNKAIVKVKVKVKEDTTVKVSNVNQLWGDWFIVQGGKAIGDNLVAIEAKDNGKVKRETLKLRPKKKAERKIVKALKKRKKVKDKLKLTLTDEARNKGINVYSFALYPELHQPSGTTNLSRIDNCA